jgi:hypothetical protein
MTVPAPDPESSAAMRSLLSRVCPLCGGGKYKGRTFCDGCFVAIGPAVRAGLCVGAAAYPAAFAAAYPGAGTCAGVAGGGGGW